ncbi:MAG: holo-ACP synthase [Defluviitoga tunisiensis]|jgi:holo-[acyl-carrier protein] synthase|uniref:Holo-[acyl-carrier-protein] synthase n=1 Tax=Defluviitoga tunisiensis TaxID=1006576 RepID=A0A0C7P0P6_DEFTU|nr:holo-ACP synthase [Defluviitoga tunisiensis]MDD3600494.1 holo-ACP synthase [Defluviitoga tunisiensis]MDY0379135.1 holo-ACP synthase [Defluviitoga tunisiensis]CEP77604.1 4'-phosphopantetheinyl transferase [Defluviitoga tunisiensis]HHV00628.1 holo-ACP synthase [Defluviitoga tunisiensis]HOB55291.1 holo-ACP synthase [Defluviitoga tunisiensis]
MIRGIGIDIVKIDRINDNNIKKILSIKEREIYNGFKGNRKKQEFAAGRFAAKEAIIKCFKSYIPYSRITILEKENGEPFIDADSSEYIFNQFGGEADIHITISHEREYAIAAAIVVDKCGM